MKRIFTFSVVLSAMLSLLPVSMQAEMVWKKGEALITSASQITATPPHDSRFTVANLIRPESDGVGTNQYIYHTAWSGSDMIGPGEDPFLQFRLPKAEQHLIFSMIGSAWQATYDTPTEVVIQAADNPNEGWTTIMTLKNMEEDFTSFTPERYTSPHIDLGAAYTNVKFLVKKTYANRRQSAGGLLLSLGRFQIYEAYEGEPDPIDPKENINLLFIGNSITAGATLSNASTQAPPIVCRSLIQNATGVTTNVYNGGHSGITTWGYLPGRDDFTRIVSNAKAFRKSNGGLIYISIMLGTNDSACTTTEGAPVSPDTYANNIRTIIEKLIAEVPDCKIVLNYPIWYSPSTYNGAMYLQEGLDRLHSYYPYLDAIVGEYEQVFAGNRGVWEYFENNFALFTRESGNAGYFYLHPNVNGAKRLAEIWAKSLLQLIEADGIEVKNPLPEWNTFKPQNNKKYSMKTTRGSMGVKDGKMTSTVKTAIGATKGEFAFISHEGQLYLYSISDHSFMYRDPNPFKDDWSNVICSNDFLQPIKVNYTGTPTNYPYYLTMDGYVFNSAASTQTGICANTYTPHDAGNQTAITEEGDFDPTEALAQMQNFFDRQITVIYRIVDTTGRVLEELTDIGMEGEVITEVPGRIQRKPYTTYTVMSPVTLTKGQENVVIVGATWTLPFDVSPSLDNAHWYNLALREGADFVNAAEGYICNTAPTKDELNGDAYQWAFQGNPYDGIVLYNRSDVTKTLSKVYSEEKQNYVAVLADGTFKWRIVESDKGFLLATDGSYPYINEYGGAGGHLGFWGNISDVGSIFTVCEVGEMKVENVRLSTGAKLTLYRAPAEKANGKAVILIPGGGYAYVAGAYESSDWAPFYNDLGFTAAVLTYNLPNGNPEVPLNDGRAALQYLRDNAEDLLIKPDLIGVMGFSAGGHLASTIATHLTGEELPAFQVLFYPVITMDSRYTHAGSRQNLLGDNPSEELVKLYSNDLQVTAETPPAYLCWASDDSTVKPTNSIKYRSALNKVNVPVSYKTFSSGGHGFGFNPSFAYHNQMLTDLTKWLQKLNGLITGLPSIGETEQTATIYNLLGQRLCKMQKGINIVNGRKIVKSHG
ncbi:MAG: alpha/beta hydrolase fold domain-containing protein [Bacteroidaceae bacterium]|nr:alpha/beta hydrolase fold domain-containing protein [Bacteroidaceae bacterium]